MPREAKGAARDPGYRSDPQKPAQTVKTLLLSSCRGEMKTEEVDAATFLKHLRGSTRKKAGVRRPDIPRATPDERSGLTPLVAQRGWSLWSDGGRTRLYQLRNRAMDTGICESLQAACLKAKAMEQEHAND
jgi:hypothetical protein